MQLEKKEKLSVKKVVKSLVWIVLLSFFGLVIMLFISPDAKALSVFLIGFFLAVVLIVLIAVYINYAVTIYKQIKED